MKMKQKPTKVNPVVFEFDEEETRLIDDLISQEPENSILIGCYQVTGLLFINADELDSFWTRIDEILGIFKSNTPTKLLLISISNKFSDSVQFPHNSI